MELTPRVSRHNFYAFIWHASFLAFAQNFMDVDTVIPSMVVDSGGTAFHIGLMTAIMLGGSSFTQLLFAPLVGNQPSKKRFLIGGINVRIFSLLALGFMLYRIGKNADHHALGMIFLFITLFSLAGAFTNISYVDILGKSILQDRRKRFFSSRQIVAGTLVLISALFAKKMIAAFPYPGNYSRMFFIGGGLLFIASLGFWVVKEVHSNAFRIRGFRQFFQTMRSEIRENPRLVYLLGFINTQGIIVSFLPFVVLYAKESLQTHSTATGFFLLFKVFGVVGVSLFIFLVSKKIKYNPLLYLNVILSLTLISLTFVLHSENLLRYIFLLGGIAYSLYSITMNGMLLEISSTENRALYTGFAGAGNIMPALFPLLGGWLIARFGFWFFAVLAMMLILSALIFIVKIRCKR